MTLGTEQVAARSKFSGLDFPTSDVLVTAAWREVATGKHPYLRPGSQGPAVAGLIGDLRRAAMNLSLQNGSEAFTAAVDAIPKGTTQYTPEVVAAVEAIQQWQLDRQPDGKFVKTAKDISAKDGLAGEKTAATLDFINSAAFTTKIHSEMVADFPPFMGRDLEPSSVTLSEPKKAHDSSVQTEAAFNKAIAKKQYIRLGSSGPAAAHAITLLKNLANEHADNPAAAEFVKAVAAISTTNKIDKNAATAIGAYQDFYAKQKQIVTALYRSHPELLAEAVELPKASGSDKVIGPMTLASMQLDPEILKFEEYAVADIPWKSQYKLAGDPNWRTACYRVHERIYKAKFGRSLPSGMANVREFVIEQDGEAIVSNHGKMTRDLANLETALKNGDTAVMWVSSHEGSSMTHPHLTASDHAVMPFGLLKYQGHEFLLARDPAPASESKGAYRIFTRNAENNWTSPGLPGGSKRYNHNYTASMIVFSDYTQAFLDKKTGVMLAAIP